MYISIPAIEKIKKISYTKCYIYIDSLELDSNAVIRAIITDEDETESKTFVYQLEGKEYGFWKTDDYLKEWVLSKIKYECF